MNEKLARQSRALANEADDPEEKLTAINSESVFLRCALKMARNIREDRETKEATGLRNVNSDRLDKAEGRRDEIRQVLKLGMSAGDVQNALRRANLEPYPRSTIEKDLPKIRGAKNSLPHGPIGGTVRRNKVSPDR